MMSNMKLASVIWDDGGEARLREGEQSSPLPSPSIYDKGVLPERRSWGCDSCHKDVPTEMFLGFNRNCLWICAKCRKKMLGNMKERKHMTTFSVDIERYKGGASR